MSVEGAPLLSEICQVSGSWPATGWPKLRAMSWTVPDVAGSRRRESGWVPSSRPSCGSCSTVVPLTWQTWRAQQGPAREVFFAQQHRPGEVMQTDFTWANELGVTLDGVPLSTCSVTRCCPTRIGGGRRCSLPSRRRHRDGVGFSHRVLHRLVFPAGRRPAKSRNRSPSPKSAKRRARTSIGGVPSASSSTSRSSARWPGIPGPARQRAGDSPVVVKKLPCRNSAGRPPRPTGRGRGG